VVYSPDSKDVNTEAEESPFLKFLTGKDYEFNEVEYSAVKRVD
jgi:hypothetical protein